MPLAAGATVTQTVEGPGLRHPSYPQSFADRNLSSALTTDQPDGFGSSDGKAIGVTHSAPPSSGVTHSRAKLATRHSPALGAVCLSFPVSGQ